MSISPIHYRTHTCNVKGTRSDWLCDTMQFQHKNITNPTITHQDKIMKALANCHAAIHSLPNHKHKQDFCDLQRLVQLTNTTSSPPTAQQPTTSLPQNDAPQPLERIVLPNQRITRSMTGPTHTVPRVAPTSLTINASHSPPMMQPVPRVMQIPDPTMADTILPHPPRRR